MPDARTRCIVAGVNVAKRHQRPTRGDDAGRHHRQGHAAPRLARSRSSAPRTARPGSATRSTTTATRSGSAAKCGSDAVSADRRRERPRLDSRYDDELRAAAARRARPAQRDGGPAPREDRLQLRRRPGHPAAVAARGRGARPRSDHRPEAGRDQGAAVDRRLQAARGQRHRRDGDAARRPDVGVLRPADQPRDPADP